MEFLWQDWRVLLRAWMFAESNDHLLSRLQFLSSFSLYPVGSYISGVRKSFQEQAKLLVKGHGLEGE